MRKLTDVELSKVLSRHSDGKLKHAEWHNPVSGCGCVAGTITTEFDDEGKPVPISPARRISKAVFTQMVAERGWTETWEPVDYPSDTEEMLRLLERAGLA